MSFTKSAFVVVASAVLLLSVQNVLLHHMHTNVQGKEIKVPVAMTNYYRTMKRVFRDAHGMFF